MQSNFLTLLPSLPSIVLFPRSPQVSFLKMLDTGVWHYLSKSKLYTEDTHKTATILLGLQNAHAIETLYEFNVRL